MTNPIVQELRSKNDAAWERLARALDGMDAHLEATDAPGEWTARQVLCHLLGAPGGQPVALLERFAAAEPPLLEITPGAVTVTAERARMTLADLVAALDGQRRQVFDYLDGVGGAGLAGTARVPLFQPLLGGDVVPLPVFVGILFDRHWTAHAEQLEKIRRAAGLPEPLYTTPTLGGIR